MALGNNILISNPAKGVFREGIIDGTPLPGICVHLKRSASTPTYPANHEWEPAGTTAAAGAAYGMAADGDRIAVAILLEKSKFGQTASDAYVDGEPCDIYFPLPGEEMNVLLENQSGTADDFRVGDKLIVDDGTGKFLISAGTTESEPFQCLEAKQDVTADYLIHAMATGQ